MSTIYQFRIKGQIDGKHKDWFGRLTVSHTTDGHTLLTGEVGDQAALHGIINRCRDLGLTLISANPVSDLIKTDS